MQNIKILYPIINVISFKYYDYLKKDTDCCSTIMEKA